MAVIVITTTATLRPEILAKTLETFRSNLFTDEALRLFPTELILNIDPAGHGSATSVMEIARAYFPVSAVRCPAAPSFPKAFMWAWLTAAQHKTARYVFHLEDDWELMGPVSLEDMIRTIEQTSDLGVLRLPAFFAGKVSMKNWNIHFPWNGQFYECPEDLRIAAGFCGHPSLIRMEFVRNAAPLLEGSRNPEKQFHRGGPSLLLKEVAKWRYGVWGAPGRPPIIRDIGRQWMIKNSMAKSGSKAFFTNWEKVNA